MLSGAFLGFLLLTAVYNIAFYVVLHERFLIWQAARVVLLVALTISLSSLPLGSLLDSESTSRQVLINVLFDTSVAIVGLFLRSLLAPELLEARLRQALLWQAALVASTTPVMLMDPRPPLYMAFRDAVLVGVLALLCWSLVQAILRGSRAALFQLVAWAAVLTVCGVSLFHDIVLERPFGLFLYALFAALAVEMLLSSFEAGARFMRLKRQHDEARVRAETLKELAYTDPLTGLPNRRSLEARFASHRPRAMAIIDVDHFKQVNDRYGHDQGDAVLIAVADALASGPAFAGRMGGEEFALLLYGSHPDREAETLLRHIPHRVARDVPGLDRSVTASAGLARLRTDMAFSECLRMADINLYAAKTGGRDRLVSSEVEPPRTPAEQPIGRSAV